MKNQNDHIESLIKATEEELNAHKAQAAEHVAAHNQFVSDSRKKANEDSIKTIQLNAKLETLKGLLK